MKIQDDRKNPYDYPVLVVGRDTFLSGWGRAEGGESIAAWACNAGQQNEVMAWVKSRSDMQDVRIVYDFDGLYRAEDFSNVRHFHIYVVKENHPALEGAMKPEPIIPHGELGMIKALALIANESNKAKRAE